MNFKQIETFVCLYEERNVTRAAIRLNMVQPAVSAQLRGIERTLKVSLFDRNSRGIDPTSAGAELYRLYVPILADIRDAEKRAKEIGEGRQDKISIGLNPSATSSVLADVLMTIAERFPKVSFRVAEDNSARLCESVGLGLLDLGIVTFSNQKDGLVYETLLHEDLVFVRQRQRRTHAGPVQFRDLAHAKLILPPPNFGYRGIIDRVAADYGMDLAPVLEVSAAAPTVELVSKTQFATILPAIIAGKLQSAHPIDVAPIQSPKLTRRMCAVYRKKMELQPLHALLISTIRERFRSLTRDFSNG